MKQPNVRIEDLLCVSPEFGGNEEPEYWLYITDGADNVEVSVASTESSAYRNAAKKLRSLADECERRASNV